MRSVRGGWAATLAAVACAATALLGGCGSSVDASALQKQLSGVADAIDGCVAKTNDARKCTTAAALRRLPAGTKLGSGDGEVSIDAPRALAYTLTGAAGDQVDFVLEAQPVGARRKLCRPAGTGACGKDGVW